MAIGAQTEIAQPWGQDFALAPNGDLLLVQDTDAVAAATSQRLYKMLMTSPTLRDVNGYALGEADDLFNPHWGAGLPAAVGELNTASLVNGIRARILAALASDAGIASSPTPTVTATSVTPSEVVFAIACSTVTGQAVTIPQFPLKTTGG